MKLVGMSACVPKKIVKPAEYAYEKFKPFDVDRIVGGNAARLIGIER